MLITKFTTNAAGEGAVNQIVPYVPANVLLCKDGVIQTGASITVRGSVQDEGFTVVNVTTQLAQTLHQSVLQDVIVTDNISFPADAISLKSMPVGLLISDGERGRNSSLNLKFTGLAASTEYELYTTPQKTFSRYYSIEERSIAARNTERIAVSSFAGVFFDYADLNVSGRIISMIQNNDFTTQLLPNQHPILAQNRAIWDNAGNDAVVGFTALNVGALAMPNTDGLVFENNANIVTFVTTDIFPSLIKTI